jgi:hypothetical protein
MRLRLRPEVRAQVEGLIRREAACCSFLDLTLSSEDDHLLLDITSPVADAGPTIASLAGTLPDDSSPCC